MGTIPCEFYFEYTTKEGTTVGMNYIACTSNANSLSNSVPAIKSLAQAIISSTFDVSTETPLQPMNLEFSNSQGSFAVNLK